MKKTFAVLLLFCLSPFSNATGFTVPVARVSSEFSSYVRSLHSAGVCSRDEVSAECLSSVSERFPSGEAENNRLKVMASFVGPLNTDTAIVVISPENVISPEKSVSLSAMEKGLGTKYKDFLVWHERGHVVLRRFRNQRSRLLDAGIYPELLDEPSFAEGFCDLFAAVNASRNGASSGAKSAGKLLATVVASRKSAMGDDMEWERVVSGLSSFDFVHGLTKWDLLRDYASLPMFSGFRGSRKDYESMFEQGCSDCMMVR